MKMQSGYAHECDAVDWRRCSSEDWRTSCFGNATVDGAAHIGQRRIDGYVCNVFRLRNGIIAAQVALDLVGR